MATQTPEEEISFWPAATPTINMIEHPWQLPPDRETVQVFIPLVLSTPYIVSDFHIRTPKSSRYIHSRRFMETHDVMTLTRATCRFRQQPGLPIDEKLLAELLYWGIGNPTWNHSDQKELLRPRKLWLKGCLIEVYEGEMPLPSLPPPLPDSYAPSLDSNKHVSSSSSSDFSSLLSFQTASSLASYWSARTTVRYDAIVEADETPSAEPHGPLQRLAIDYQAELKERQLIQTFDKELNWSGRGQHVVFEPKEQVPLEVISSLGASATARVEMVRCRRVALARKTMRCKGDWSQNNVLSEVQHLQKFKHFHVVQLVGTYLQGRDFSLLMYPAADCHLGIFMEDTQDLRSELKNGRSEEATTRWPEYNSRILFLHRSLYCLASAVTSVHQQLARHMDIKPQNILVKWSDNSLWTPWQIYLSDFGLSRTFADQCHSQTDGPTPLTPKYCAPEVYEYESRGRSSDIFSLGCVYSEMLTVVAGTALSEFAEFRQDEDGDQSFHRNLGKVAVWMNKNFMSPTKVPPEVISLVWNMLHTNPSQRPKAYKVMQSIKAQDPNFPLFGGCCRRDPEPYIAYSGPPGAAIFPRELGVKSLTDLIEHA
ncbi:kinase-like protein [Paraphaeosphaeria sporulosa]|uniref:Kinase-like protein n=1 Tax=Paraphaeosphaeria sporulosa TaxID=1460663 RepID=A0A177CES1_9PLEO|nr:kinase-like protein [Paraphaeosphaeria sporulosa]OAG05230.1 kinase-like protein [Paraphaeosphaeria sporulosa]